MKLFDLESRIALVTGAAQGLGVAIADAMHVHGARLVLSDRDDAWRHALRFCFGDAELLAADLNEPGSAEALAEEALRRCGRIDTVVCNAGIRGPAAPLTQASDEDWDALFGRQPRLHTPKARALGFTDDGSLGALVVRAAAGFCGLGLCPDPCVVGRRPIKHSRHARGSFRDRFGVARRCAPGRG